MSPHSLRNRPLEIEIPIEPQSRGGDSDVDGAQLDGQVGIDRVAASDERLEKCRRLTVVARATGGVGDRGGRAGQCELNGVVETRPRSCDVGVQRSCGDDRLEGGARCIQFSAAPIPHRLRRVGKQLVPLGGGVVTCEERRVEARGRHYGQDGSCGGIEGHHRTAIVAQGRVGHLLQFCVESQFDTAGTKVAAQ